MSHADLGRQRLQPGVDRQTRGIALGADQVQQPCLDGVQAQAFALLAQAPNRNRPLSTLLSSAGCSGSHGLWLIR